MKVVFVSNFLNHHQLPFCEEMIKRLGKENFKFIATEKIPDERIKLGYEDMNNIYPFVIRAYENQKEALDFSVKSDIAIIGSAPELYIRNRVKDKNKLTFRYSERLYKTYRKIHCTGPIRTFIKSNFLEKNRVYLLCASAYAYNDFLSGFSYRNRAFKWGYFPEFKKYNIKKLIKNKKKKSIVWVARYIDWKHPEIPVELAKMLRNDGFDFCIDMIGNGELLDNIRNDVKKYHLENYVNIVGSVPANEVRKYMEADRIFLFTSDRGEGWGAVLNEAMNSGCVPIVNCEIGSAPYLIKDAYNGFLYKDGDIYDLYNKLKNILSNENIQEIVSLNAYQTIAENWNPEKAVSNFIVLSNFLLKNKNMSKYKIRYGPCSKAEIIKDNWY